MPGLIAAINMTLDGFCDHTAMIGDEGLHHHYTTLLRNADAVLYGRITYQLMEFWPPLVKNPTGNKGMDEFAVAIDHIPKIVFSNTLKNTEWKTARIATRGLADEVLDLKRSRNKGSKDILVGSPSLIVALTNLNLIDEYQLCIHPVIAGSGLPLFKNINSKCALNLIRTKTLDSGATILYYEPAKNV